MNYNLILKNICKHIDLTNKEKDFFTSLLEAKRVKKKEFLLKAGEIAKATSFVNEGCLKGYTVDKNGTEHVLQFACRDWWIGDMYSLISGSPGILNIEALADTDVLLLFRKDQQKLFEKVPRFERFFRILLEKSLVAHQQRLINNLSLTAEERYLEFIKKYPAVLEFAPLHTIASYLGITPEFLSKIRARLARKQR